ncbi:hypothetical protein [Streptomyces sp. NPDC002547]
MSTDRRLARLDLDLHRLGVTRRVSGRVRVAVRRRTHLRLWLFGMAAASLVFTIFAAGLITQLLPVVGSATSKPATPWSWRTMWENGLGAAAAQAAPSPPDWLWYTAGALIAVCALCILFVAAVRVAAFLHSGQTQWNPQLLISLGWLQAARRYALVVEIAGAISTCADAYTAGGERKAVALRRVSRRTGAVTRALGAAHRQRKSVPRYSHRRKALKAHERRVAAALRRAEARLDVEPQAALRELVDLLLTIAERYCEGRVGALLDDAQLDGVEAGTDLDWLRFAVTAVLVGGSAIAVSQLGLPDGAEPYVTVCAGLVCIAVVWRQRVQRGLDLLSVVFGA